MYEEQAHSKHKIVDLYSIEKSKTQIYASLCKKIYENSLTGIGEGPTGRFQLAPAGSVKWRRGNENGGERKRVLFSFLFGEKKRIKF